MEIVLAFDGDEAGEKAIARNIKVIDEFNKTYQNKQMLSWKESDNKYFGKYFVFTQDEVDYLDALEVEWSKTQRRLKLHELLDVFPEAKPVALKLIDKRIKLLRAHFDTLLKAERQYKNSITTDSKHANLYKLWIEDIAKDRKELNREVKRLAFLRYYATRSIEKKEYEGKITDLDIRYSKEIPIESLFSGKLTSSGRNRLLGRCEFHEDKTPSFMIYKDQNSWYCFSCNAGGDVIDYVKKKLNIDFIEAIKHILHK